MWLARMYGGARTKHLVPADVATGTRGVPAAWAPSRRRPPAVALTRRCRHNFAARARTIALRSTGGNFASPTVTQLCLANNRTGTDWVHTDTPPAGQGVWYLVRSQPGGSYDSGASSQSGSRDPEIAASGNACP